MKNIPQSLLDFLLSTDVESCFISDLFLIQLQSGTILYITDGQLPIQYAGQVYEPVKWGSWQCTSTNAGMGMLNSEASVTIMANEDSVLPISGVSMLTAIQTGLFDAAYIEIRTTFGLVYGETGFGTVIRFAGVITELQKTGRTTATASCKPNTFILNQNMPRHVLQPGCGWVLGDAGCTVNLANYTQQDSTTTTNQTLLVPSTAITKPDGYYTQGVVKFTSGKNTGQRGFIQLHVGNTLKLVRPVPFPVEVGDTFTMTAGCDHTLTTCQSKFGNLIHIQAAPYIPNQESSL